MKLVLLIVAVTVMFRASTGTMSYLEKNKAYLTSLSSGITNIISSIEKAAEDVVEEVVTVEPSSVTLYYYNQSSIDDYIVSFTLADTSSLDLVFNASKETIYVVHGYFNTWYSEVNLLIKAAVLGRYDVNLFVVDWPAISGYVYAYDSVIHVGTYLGEFINYVNKTYDYSNLDVTLAGHSLGAHICGIAGQVTNGTVGNIVGMDPAGPLYNLDTDIDTRLSPDDALYVQAIHTNSKIYGIKFPVGDSDFWVNGGASQPGCDEITDLASCSHLRSYKFYAESVESGGFDAVKCRVDTSSKKSKSSCDKPLNTVYMGEYDLDKRARGDYCLTTNADAPYARGIKFPIA